MSQHQGGNTKLLGNVFCLPHRLHDILTRIKLAPVYQASVIQPDQCKGAPRLIHQFVGRSDDLGWEFRTFE